MALERADLDRMPLGSGVTPDADVVFMGADEDAVADADDGVDPRPLLRGALVGGVKEDRMR